jgi:hypothetical protein
MGEDRVNETASKLNLIWNGWRAGGTGNVRGQMEAHGTDEIVIDHYAYIQEKKKKSNRELELNHGGMTE